MATEKTVKLNTGLSLNAYLTKVMGEGVKSALAQKALDEKDKQAALSGGSDDEGGEDNDSLFGSDDSSPSPDAGGQDKPSTSSKTMDDETDKLKDGEVTTKDIVDKLNAIRSGKSFKDQEVAQAMDDYINSLSKAERVALFAFCKGISQILTGEIPGKQAEEPSENPADVKMQKGDKQDVRHVKPNVIKGANSGSNQPTQDGQKKKAPVEDTTAPSAPIVPKRRN